MKLEDIKAIVDSYFDSISEEDFFNLLTNEYHMPIVYDTDLMLALREIKKQKKWSPWLNQKFINEHLNKF